MLKRVRHIGLVLAGMAVAWAMGSCSEGACTVGAYSRGTSSFGACSRVEEARRVVAEADSLRAVGVTYSDSAAMAQAAHSLEWVRVFYPTDYAHANYYLGRILRNSGDHPAAMEAFLRVTHSRTNDHTIKGRAYCNIGIMCGLATEHEQAYSVYECSAKEFLQARDTTAYYYALNDMAFELAEAKRTDEAIALTEKINEECFNFNVLVKTWETKAIIYNRAQLYDSTIYYINLLQAIGYNESTGILCKAQAFANLGQKDSAVYYANRVMEITTDWNDRYNALYILSHDNPLLDNEEILALTSDRADLGKLQEARQGFLSQAVQLLEQDLNRKPNLGWVWAILVTLLTVGIPSSIYISRKRKKHQLASQKTAELQRKNKVLSEQTQQMKQRQAEHRNMRLQEIEKMCTAIQHSHDWKKEVHWDKFNELCEVINSQFFFLADKLKAIYPLDEKEIRLCILVFLDMFTLKEIAALLNYSEKGIRTYKSRINKKLGNNGKDLRFFLVELAILSPENR